MIVPPKPPNKILCELCGSDITDVLKEVSATINAPSVPIQPTIPAPVSQNRQNSLPDYQNMPAFPISAILKQTHPRLSPNRPTVDGQTSMPGIQPSPGSGAMLQFPQLKQKILIPNNVSEFYFGRNAILPLVNPAEYDVEWLNSISRVQKDPQYRVVKQHFTITRDQSGNYFIEDSQSAWGTWVNRQQIKNKGKVQLRNGDKIELMLSKPMVQTIFPLVILFQS
jgi:hypothetical protein